VISPLITTDLTYHQQKKQMLDIFSEQEQDHYITMGEMDRIRKEIERERIRLDSNDANSTRIWLETLQSEGNFICYKDKLDLILPRMSFFSVFK
jgi:hypothetical protein